MWPPYTIYCLALRLCVEYKATTGLAGLTLNDEDKTTKEVNGWKRINTLRHYNVKSGTTLQLVAKQPNAATNESIYSMVEDDDDDLVRNVHGESKKN